MRTLVLNSTYEPLGTVSDKRALNLILKKRAVAIEESGKVFHYIGGEVNLPAVILLKRFVKVPYGKRISLTRKSIFARDAWKCVYCASPATSIDHVFPKSRGGEHTWENVVAACTPCNSKKADKTLKELGWKLKFVPYEPKGVAWKILTSGSRDESWISYL